MRLRDKLVLKFWDRSGQLTIKNELYRNYVKNLSGFLLKTDIGKGDMTTSSLTKKEEIIVVIKAKEKGIVAGLEEFSLINGDLELEFLKKDGERIDYGTRLLKIKGDAKKILERERAWLNMLQRMSGIATNANELNKRLKNTRLAATRKTFWGLMDKKAVSVGHGLTHRLGLDDGILIKDNHLKIQDDDISGMLDSIKSKSRLIEIEVEKMDQSIKAAKAIGKMIKDGKKISSLFAMMLDKIPPNEIRRIIGTIKELGLYEKILFEASGNINEKNLEEYSGCGADIISMGSLTNSARALNMSLDIE